MMSHKTELFNQWNAVRLRENKWSALVRIPVLGFAVKTAVRIRNFGKLLELQANLYTEFLQAIEHQENLLNTLGQAEIKVNGGSAQVYFRRTEPSPGIAFDIALLDKSMPDGSDDPVIAILKRGQVWISPCYQFIFDMIRLNPERSGLHVIDVGAHIGTFSLAAAALDCQVIAIEASKLNADLLELSRKANDFQNLRVVNAVAGNESGVKAFMPNGPYGTLVESGSTLQIAHMRAITIDQLTSDTGWAGVDFVKIDVEGWESEVLQGMSEVMASSRAPVVCFESNIWVLDHRKQSAQDLIDLVRRYDYEVYWVDQSQIYKLDPKHTQVPIVTDYIAIKKSIDISALLKQMPTWSLHAPITDKDRILQLEEQIKGDLPDYLLPLLLRTIASFDEKLRVDPRVVSVQRTLTARLEAEGSATG